MTTASSNGRVSERGHQEPGVTSSSSSEPGSHRRRDRYSSVKRVKETPGGRPYRISDAGFEE
jgi:hypothetical protein